MASKLIEILDDVASDAKIQPFKDCVSIAGTFNDCNELIRDAIKNIAESYQGDASKQRDDLIDLLFSYQIVDNFYEIIFYWPDESWHNNG